MDVIVLAGGQGTRLRPLTYDVPKPLLPVCGRPMLSHLLKRLPAACDRVLLTVSHRADAMRAWVEAGSDPALGGRTVDVVDELEPLGTGGAVANCRNRLEGPVLVLNGDLVADFSLQRLVDVHRERTPLATVALVRVADPSRFGVVDLDAAGRVTAFVEKPAPGTAPSDLVNAGAYVLSSDAVARIPRGRAVSIEREVFPGVAATDPGMVGVRFTGNWVDCGTPESYVEAHRVVAAATGVHDVRGYRSVRAATAPGVYLEEAVLLDDARVGSATRLLRTVVAAGAVVGARCSLVDCVVGPGAAVADGTRARRTRFGLRGAVDDPPVSW